ncbi:MAG TPA: hypothetical protein VGQ93_15330 [Lysobacter sp.]|jgi:hypothetical protein|nr:hypothetical protein [Lysobacter sp.]
MRSLNRVGVVAAAVLTLFALGCTTKPIYNVNNAPVITAKQASLADVQAAIQRAGITLGWQMAPTAPGHIVGTLALRDHLAVVDISYTPKTYSIVYKDSTNLGADGQNIHNNYNGWIQNLDRSIQAQLRTF